MLDAWQLWVIAGLALWIVEIFTPGFVIGLFATACLAVAPFAGAGVSFKMQVLVFGVATVIMTLGVRPLVLNHFYGQDPKIRTNVDALIGKSGFVTETLDHQRGSGSVKIGGELWRAITQNESPVEIGRKVTVREVDGNKLVVETITEKEGNAS